MCKIEIVVPFLTKKISSLEECHSYPKVVLALAILLALLAIFFLCVFFNPNISLDKSQLLLDLCIGDDILLQCCIDLSLGISKSHWGQTSSEAFY